MKRRKFVALVICMFCVNEIVINYCCCDVVSSFSPPSSQVSNFQNAIQQQNTISILSSIEERLRNLDNIYSMQLSQNIESKLDQYNRKLENLESKVMRLESIVMMNLAKISENISTKNFKDDITKTETVRKLDSIYESIMHRFNYIERKLETNNVKIQEKVESTFAYLDQMEKGTTKRDSDLETELSAVIAAIDDLKKTYKTTEQKVSNITQDNLNVSKHTFTLLTKYNADNRKSMNKLHDNIVGILQYSDNRTTQQMKITEDTNIILKQMKVELKEDFNSYANKVADMNSDMWKNTDTTEDDLKNIGSVVNSTKSELQNGVRSLMIQIGKLSQKENDVTSGSDYKEIEQKMSTNFDKILTNQEVFLESCHRLQMDESQIESEISVMLNKLIDMLEKKFASEVKDIKNFEKNLKSHDNRINRNLFQANQNIISLFEKTTMNTQMVTSEIRKIGTDLNALFAFVQSTTNEGGSPALTALTSKVILDKLNGIERSSRNLENILSNQKIENVSNHQVFKEVQKLSKSLSTIVGKIQNFTRYFNDQQNDSISKLENIIKKNIITTTSTTLPVMPPLTKPVVNETMRQAIKNVFGNNPYHLNQTIQNQKKNCTQNYRNLIDIRADASDDCVETPQKPTKKPRRRKLKYDIDIRGDINSRMIDEDDDYEDSATEGATVTTETTTTTNNLTEENKTVTTTTEENDNTNL